MGEAPISIYSEEPEGDSLSAVKEVLAADDNGTDRPFEMFGRSISIIEEKEMTATIVILVLLLLVIGYGVKIYNSLIKKRVATENAWSQIDVQLKRRHDVIPNLVETVKGYAGHEQDTLERVIQARNTAIAAGKSNSVAEQSQAENFLTGALKQIFALSEAYPDLKANENFMQLQEEITSTENRISFARQHYNDSTATYNAAIQQIPNNIVAGFGGFTAKEFFELDPAEAEAVQQPPQVSFS